MYGHFICQEKNIFTGEKWFIVLSRRAFMSGRGQVVSDWFFP